ncbi:MAG TPA: 2Fe-2S iron-sulfur cluster-binding protein [Povalibacter sp.]|nr:2Fe-2S iron-sulfur cluster-binding protein [Povalibacter sp.]
MTYIEFDGTERTVEVDNGMSLMAGAVANDIRGIDADCGGCAACGTCHVHVHPDWQAVVGPPASDGEEDMLQFASGSGPDSRLACQIEMRDELDGVIVHVPENQH